MPVFVSETRDLYQCQITLSPMEDADRFDLIQDRSGKMRNEELGIRNERRLYEGCRIKSFELRIMRGEAVKLKLDICGDKPPVVYPYINGFNREAGERFSGDCVAYKINGKEYDNIYGLTLSAQKEGGTKTELWIKRVLEKGNTIPEIIDELIITAQLLRDNYEYKHYGNFRITVKRLVLITDETNINSSDTEIAPLRYYVAGTVTTEVFTAGGGILQ